MPTYRLVEKTVTMDWGADPETVTIPDAAAYVDVDYRDGDDVRDPRTTAVVRYLEPVPDAPTTDTLTDATND